MKLKNKTTLIITMLTFSLCLNFKVNAENVLMPCLKDERSVGLSKMLSFNCKVANAVASTPSIKNDFKNKVNHKLAKKLQVKAFQRIHEIALLDSYYRQNDSDLMLNSKDVKDNCRLDVISTPTCGNNKKIDANKLNILLGKFPKSKNSGEGIFGKLKDEMNNVRGAQFDGNNQCPIEGESGDFILSSQFTEADAEKFNANIKDSNPRNKNEDYDRFAQLRMIKEAKELGAAGLLFANNFENKIKNYSSEKGSYKEFINNILFSKDSNEVMAKVVASRCMSLAKDFKAYLCEDDESLDMSDQSAKGIFEDEEVEELTIAKSFSCLRDEPEFKLKNGNRESSLDRKYDAFISGVRDPIDLDDAKRTVLPFCEIYSCKADIVKNMQSCKQHNKVTSEDLLKTCKGEKLEGCTASIQRYISLLQSFEEDVKIRKIANDKDSASTPEEQKKKKGFSSFFQNFMGVEGTLMAEGKKATPAAIAEKTAEFAEKKIEPTVQSSVAQAKPAEARQEPLAPMVKSQEAPADYEQQATVVATTNPSQNADKYKDAFYSTNGSPSDKSAKAVATKTNKLDIPDTSDPRADEMKKIRKELEEALSGFQGTEEEKLGTITDNHRAIVAPKSVVASDSGRSVNQAEKDRLDQYRQSLNDWESRLRDRETRNFMNSGSGSGGSGSASGSVAGRDASGGAGSSSSGSSSSAGEAGTAGGAPSLKLSKGAGGAAAAKADGASDRGTASEKAENENGVLNADTLAILKKETLKDLGIVASDSFVIKIRYQNKIYPIPVKTFVHDGKSMYVPLLTDKNSELAKIVYESPLFNDYRRYQLERHLKQTKDQ